MSSHCSSNNSHFNAEHNYKREVGDTVSNQPCSASHFLQHPRDKCTQRSPGTGQGQVPHKEERSWMRYEQSENSQYCNSRQALTSRQQTPPRKCAMDSRSFQNSSLPSSPESYDEHFNRHAMDNTTPPAAKSLEVDSPFTRDHFLNGHQDSDFLFTHQQSEQVPKVISSRKATQPSSYGGCAPRRATNEKFHPSSPEFAQYLKKIKSLSTTGSYPVFQRSASAVRVPRTSSTHDNCSDYPPLPKSFNDSSSGYNEAYGTPFANRNGHSSEYSQKPYSRLVSSLDTSSLGHSALSPNGAVGFELDYETIQKQRRELQLLITELKDRDRELNEMVASHRRQLEAWEMDRQRLLSLEARCTKYEGEMSRKNEQIKQLANQIKVCESQDEAKQCELESLKMQLQNSTDECKNMSNTLRESEEKNGQLSRNLREATANVEELEVREQELVEVLNSKTAEMETLNGELLLLQETTQSQATQLKDLEISESNLKKENKEWRERAMECSTELSNLKPELEELAGKSSENEDKMLELQSQVDLLHKELSLTNERERRKDQLIDLQRSKQERTEAELSSLRQISERQQKEIAVLERSLHSAQDLLGEMELSGSNSNSANDARSMREYSHVYGDSTENDDGYVLPHSSSASGSLMTSYPTPTAPPHSHTPNHTHTHTPNHPSTMTHPHSSSRSCAGGVTTATLTSHKKNVTFNQKKNDVHMLNSNSSSFSP